MKNESIGERIRQKRKLKGLTQAELSELLGNSEMTVRRWESNRRSPRLEEIDQLAKALDTTPEYLSNGDTNVDIKDLKIETTRSEGMATIRIGKDRDVTAPATPEGYAFLERLFLASLNTPVTPQGAMT